MGKITRTFSIDEKTYKRFENVCKFKNVNKSKILQECVNKFIVDNFYINEQINYTIKNDDDYELYTVVKKEGEFIHLNNGNVLNIFDFEKIYEPVEEAVSKTVEYIENFKNIDEKTIAELTNNSSIDDLFENNMSDDEFEKLKENGKKLDSEKEEILELFNKPSFEPECVNNIITEKVLNKITGKEKIEVIDENEIMNNINVDKIALDISMSDNFNITEIFNIGYDVIKTKFRIYIFGDLSDKLSNYLKDLFYKKIGKKIVVVKDFQRNNLLITKLYEKQMRLLNDKLLNNLNSKFMFLEKTLNILFDDIYNSITVSNNKNVTVINVPHKYLLLPELHNLLKILDINNVFIIDEETTLNINSIVENELLPNEKIEMIKDDRTMEEKASELLEKYKKLPLIEYTLTEEAQEKIKKRLLNINDSVYNLTNIFNMKGLEFIRNNKTIYIYYDRNTSIIVEDLEKLITPLVEKIDVFYLFFIKKTSIFSVIDKTKLVNLNVEHEDFADELSELISETFSTKCEVRDEILDLTGKYDILLHTKYYRTEDLFIILNTLNIQDKVNLISNGNRLSDLIGDEYHIDIFDCIINIKLKVERAEEDKDLFIRYNDDEK